MKTVALIPIKLGSVRVPQKNIKPFFDGKLVPVQEALLEHYSDVLDAFYSEGMFRSKEY